METATNNASGSSLLDNVRLIAENSPAITVAENAVNGTVVALAVRGMLTPSRWIREPTR